MKINWVESQVGTELKTINNGGCFIYDNVLYIKTNTEEEQPDPDFRKIMVVVFDVCFVDYLFSDTLVIPIDAEINANDN